MEQQRAVRPHRLRVDIAHPRAPATEPGTAAHVL